MHIPRIFNRSKNSRPRRNAGAAPPLMLCLIAMAAGCLACSGMQGARQTQADRAMAAMESLARSVLMGIERQDRDLLLGLAVTEEEYRKIIWPALPISSQPGWKDNYPFVWGQHHAKSMHGLGTTLARYGGQHLELISIRFKGDLQDYGAYAVHRDARLRVRDVQGRQKEINIFGSIVAMGDAYKIMSYTIH